MIGPHPKTEEERKRFAEEYYRYEKEDAEATADYLKIPERRMFIICQVASLKNLELMRNDKEFALTDEEYAYARKIAFKKLKESLIYECAETKEELESDEMKEYFASLGFTDADRTPMIAIYSEEIKN